MKYVTATVFLLSLALAQSSAPATNQVQWNPSARGASKDLPDGRVQKTVATNSAAVSAIADVTYARRFVDLPADTGSEVAYVAVGIQNLSKQTIHINPSLIELRVVGKHEKQLKRLNEEQVIGRAWQGNDRTGGTLPPMAGSMVGSMTAGRTGTSSMNT